MSNNQCRAIKKNNERCGGGIQPGTDFCGPHNDNPNSIFGVYEDDLPEKVELTDDEWFWASIRSTHDFVVSATGTRKLADAPLEVKQEVLDWLVTDFNRLMGKYNNPIGMFGGATGFDTACAAAAVKAGMPYVLAIPSPTYGEYYWKDNLTLFNHYVDNAKQVIYVCDHHQYGKANFIRNQYMVDFADAFYVYGAKGSPGTQDCLNRIKTAGKPYVEVG